MNCSKIYLINLSRVNAREETTLLYINKPTPHANARGVAQVY
jgi:hypothetical protein